jgi:hypothetical protein
MDQSHATPTCQPLRISQNEITASWSFGDFRVWSLGLVLLAVGIGWGLAMSPVAWRPEKTSDRIIAIVIGPPATALLLWGATRVLRVAAAKKLIDIRLSRSGIELGHEEFYWEDIDWIGGGRRLSRPTRFELAFHVRGMPRSNLVAIPITPSLTRAELDSVLAGIERFVGRTLAFLSAVGVSDFSQAYGCRQSECGRERNSTARSFARPF